MEIGKKDKRPFKGHPLSKGAFADIKEVKDKIKTKKIPSALSDAVVFRYFASGQLNSYDNANGTTLTKQMIILNGLYGVPKIIPTIYFYGPYPYLMRETLEKLEKLCLIMFFKFFSFEKTVVSENITAQNEKSCVKIA